MPLRAPSRLWADAIELGRWCQNTEVTPSEGAITDDMFANRAGNTVIGRAENTEGQPADIQIASGQFLVNRANTLTGGNILDADLPATIARDSEVTAADAVVTAAYTAADAAHVAAADPHTQYRLESANVPYTEVSGKPAVLALLYSGTGSPEGAVTAPVGALFLRTDGGASTTLYVKESGAGNTGWIAK